MEGNEVKEKVLTRPTDAETQTDHRETETIGTYTGDDFETRRKTLKKDPQHFVHPKSYFFCDLKLRAKFHNPRTTPSGRKVCGGEEEEKEK